MRLRSRLGLCRGRSPSPPGCRDRFPAAVRPSDRAQLRAQFRSLVLAAPPALFRVPLVPLVLLGLLALWVLAVLVLRVL